MRTWIPALMLLILGRTAGAQSGAPAASPGIPQSTPAPVVAPPETSDFVTIDRSDGSQRIGGEISYVFPPSGESDITVIRLDLHGQFVDPKLHAGAYATMPLGHFSRGGSSSTALGDAEVGVIYLPPLGRRGIGVVLRTGLTLPTASTGYDNVMTNLHASVTRLADYYLIVPEGTSLRLAVSPMLRFGKVFARVDVGLDVNLHWDGSPGSDFGNAMRLDAGVGFDARLVSIMGEVTNLHFFGARPLASFGSWWDTGSVSARFHSPVTPYGAIVFPLDHDADRLMDASLTLGVEGKLR